MPKIRSITYFGNLTLETIEDTLTQAGIFLKAASNAFCDYGVQTRRFASQPFPQWIPKAELLPQQGQRIFALAQAAGIDYVSLGTVRPEDAPAYVEAIASLFATQSGVFATVSIADREHGLSLPMIQRAAQLIDNVSRITPDGMTNLYLAALANCSHGSPFFPIAYHDGGEPTFALAIQAADLAVQVFRSAESPAIACQQLTTRIQQFTDALTPIAESLAAQYEVQFGGFDFSLAPYPLDDESLGAALEYIAGPIGNGGLVTAASLIMTAIDMAQFKRTGFCGLMLPVLEDSVLARRAAEGKLQVQDLLMLSAVCGTGLDCIPLAGDVGVEALENLLLDVAALSLRLNKPLTARLMPFPNKRVGDELNFDFEFFANSKVMYVPQKRHFNLNTSDYIPIVSRR
ncbi:MAG: DUF711 domain-containing protein [Phototrophicales bacterium]|nr:MAG: DUF711 domain-containing protein [Phototrophicales bacterium]